MSVGHFQDSAKVSDTLVIIIDHNFLIEGIEAHADTIARHTKGAPIILKNSRFINQSESERKVLGGMDPVQAYICAISDIKNQDITPGHKRFLLDAFDHDIKKYFRNFEKMPSDYREAVARRIAMHIDPYNQDNTINSIPTRGLKETAAFIYFPDFFIKHGYVPNPDINGAEAAIKQSGATTKPAPAPLPR